METKTKNPVRSRYQVFTFAGGIVGLVAFLAVGLLPAIVYGGFAGITLASALFGQPLDANLIARGIVVFGMVVGLLATAGVFVVLGAALGAGTYSLARMVVRPAAEAPKPAEETHKA